MSVKNRLTDADWTIEAEIAAARDRDRWPRHLYFAAV
jgi:hypothetical protein